MRLGITLDGLRSRLASWRMERTRDRAVIEVLGALLEWRRKRRGETDAAADAASDAARDADPNRR